MFLNLVSIIFNMHGLVFVKSDGETIKVLFFPTKAIAKAYLEMLMEDFSNLGYVIKYGEKDGKIYLNIADKVLIVGDWFMMVYVVNILDPDGKILVQREFQTQCERQTYADLMVDILSFLEGRKIKDVKKEILKENKALKSVLASAREIEEKFVVTEMVVEKV